MGARAASLVVTRALAASRSSAPSEPFGPPDPRADELARHEGQVIRGIGVVGPPQRQAEGHRPVPVLVEQRSDGSPGELDLQPDVLQVRLHALRERGERDAVDGQVARILTVNVWSPTPDAASSFSPWRGFGRQLPPAAARRGTWTG